MRGAEEIKMPELRKMKQKPTTLVSRPAQGTSVYTLANPAIERASSVLFKNLEEFETAAASRFEMPYYGRYGTTTVFELEALVADLERADKTYGVASGHAAISAVLLGFLSPGDHVLLPESAYQPTKHLATGLLQRYGISVGFYPTRAGADVDEQILPTTRLIWIEAPGSLTYEIADINAIVASAHKRGIITVADNTWASGLLHQPLEHGVDVSVVSATKYMSGHADAFGGFISIRDHHRPLIEESIAALGPALAPDSAYLIHRGLRTMPVRLKQQAASAHYVADSLTADPRVSSVFHPALPSSPDYERWKKYFVGSNGLVTFAVSGITKASIGSFINALRLFHLGVSWGGFESLVWPKPLAGEEAHGDWLVRLSIGLEDPDDLLNDLRQALPTL
jgi:cystathionine beta-lyase